jgi:hypothetical protein
MSFTNSYICICARSSMRQSTTLRICMTLAVIVAFLWTDRAGAKDKPATETFQHDVCDVAAIFSRLSGTATNGTELFSPTTTEPYRTFVLETARRNGFEEPRVIGGAMDGRAAFVYFYDSSRQGPYTFAMFVADYHNWLGIAYGGRFCHLIDDELTLPAIRRGPR